MGYNIYALKDSEGWPIPGTVMRKSSAPCNAQCNWVQLDYSPASPPGTQVYHPKGFRYFYRQCDCPLPNSLFVSLKHPGGSAVEYIRYI